MKMQLTKKQEEMLYILRLDGLRREIEMHEASKAFKEAQEIEKTVQQYVIDNNEYYADVESRDSMHGERITDGGLDFLMNEEVFANDYLPKVKAAYKTLYGIDNPLNFVYSEPFRVKAHKAEQDYLMIAVDFLKISGRPEAATLEKAVKEYMRKDLKEKLMNITAQFINGKMTAAYPA